MTTYFLIVYAISCFLVLVTSVTATVIEQRVDPHIRYSLRDVIGAIALGLIPVLNLILIIMAVGYLLKQAEKIIVIGKK